MNAVLQTCLLKAECPRQPNDDDPVTILPALVGIEPLSSHFRWSSNGCLIRLRLVIVNSTEPLGSNPITLTYRLVNLVKVTWLDASASGNGIGQYQVATFSCADMTMLRQLNRSAVSITTESQSVSLGRPA